MQKAEEQWQKMGCIGVYRQAAPQGIGKSRNVLSYSSDVELCRGGYLRPKMGLVLACSQGMVSLTCTIQA